jgi:hypothetical protein
MVAFYIMITREDELIEDTVRESYAQFLKEQEEEGKYDYL